MNELLWIGFAFINFGLVILIYQNFGKTGLFAWITLAIILANIQVTKNIELFGLTATLGNIMYGTIFLITDAINELFGVKEAKKAVLLGFFVAITTLLIMQTALLFTPTVWDEGHDALAYTFGLLPRIALGSILAYLVSQWFDVQFYDFLKRKNNPLWIRNNGSTIVSQLIDTLIFVPIAFVGLYEVSVLLEIALTTYFIKVLVAFLDTPFLYLMKRITPRD
jgi:queuosine precursor transporter